MHQPLPTVGEIARRCDVPLHKVEYVIRSRQIEPVSVAGNSRVFSETQVDRIASELHRISQERTASVSNLHIAADAPPCANCGEPATHQHIDPLRSVDGPRCDQCCDRNCNHFSESYQRSRDLT